MLYTLPAERVVQLYTDILRYKQDEGKEWVERFALAAYLQTPNEDKLTFERYLISIGVKQPEIAGSEDALKKSEEILAMFKKQE